MSWKTSGPEQHAKESRPEAPGDVGTFWRMFVTKSERNPEICDSTLSQKEDVSFVKQRYFSARHAAAMIVLIS
jgi:hypothetical protein